MKKGGLRSFDVQKRFEVWFETTVKAPDIEAALETGKAMKFEDFVDMPDNVQVLGETELSGLKVGETWD